MRRRTPKFIAAFIAALVMLLGIGLSGLVLADGGITNLVMPEGMEQDPDWPESYGVLPECDEHEEYDDNTRPLCAYWEHLGYRLLKDRDRLQHLYDQEVRNGRETREHLWADINDLTELWLEAEDRADAAEAAKAEAEAERDAAMVTHNDVLMGCEMGRDNHRSGISGTTRGIYKGSKEIWCVHLDNLPKLKAHLQAANNDYVNRPWVSVWWREWTLLIDKETYFFDEFSVSHVHNAGYFFQLDMYLDDNVTQGNTFGPNKFFSRSDYDECFVSATEGYCGFRNNRFDIPEDERAIFWELKQKLPEIKNDGTFENHKNGDDDDYPVVSE